MRTYRDLRVWQLGYVLSLELHRDTRRFPDDERFELARDLRRTSRSVIYNIGEGAGRRTVAEHIHFLSIACGSASELETQIMLARDLGYLSTVIAESHLRRIADVRRMLHGMMDALGGARRNEEAYRSARTPDAGRRTPQNARVTRLEAG